MWTFQRVTACIRERAPAIFEFLDETSVAFEWIIIAAFIGVAFLYLFYSVLTPPLHVPGVRLSPNPGGL
jgi:hypothetical protein